MSEPTIVTDCCVFRIEDKHGIGPFRSQAKYKIPTFSQVLGSHQRMRDLHQDFLTISTTKHYSEFICGYHTIDHIKSYWSPELLGDLRNAGFACYKVFVRECWLTESQCLFLLENVVKKYKVII